MSGGRSSNVLDISIIHLRKYNQNVCCLRRNGQKGIFRLRRKGPQIIFLFRPAAKRVGVLRGSQKKSLRHSKPHPAFLADVAAETKMRVRPRHRCPCELEHTISYCVLGNSFFLFSINFTFHLLDKPCLQVSSLPPPSTCLRFYRAALPLHHC